VKVKSETVHQAEWRTHEKKWKPNCNETALATIAIVPDDGPVWPKHVLLD
jgi:hypothetical protein